MKDQKGNVEILNGLIAAVVTMAVMGIALFAFSDIQESAFQQDCIGGQNASGPNCGAGGTGGTDTFLYNNSIASSQGLANIYENFTTVGSVLAAVALIGLVILGIARLL